MSERHVCCFCWAETSTPNSPSQLGSTSKSKCFKYGLSGDVGSIHGKLFFQLPRIPGKRVRAGYDLAKMSRILRLAL